MTITQLKRKLGMTCYYRKRIARLEARIMRYRSNAEKITPSYSLTPGGSSAEHSKIESAVVLMLSMEENIEREIELLKQAIEWNVSVINTVPDLMQRTILEEHFIYGEKFEDIAISLSYSEMQVYRIYNAGLKYLSQHVSEC